MSHITPRLSMFDLYAQGTLDHRVLNYADGRRKEIKAQIETLELERAVLDRIIEQFDPLVCRECYGAGYTMRPAPGFEGNRYHKCTTCTVA